MQSHTKEVTMSNFVVVGRRLIPPEHIALVESYEASANPRVQSSRDFRSRVVLINRDSILIEEPTKAFAESNKFRMLPDDEVATNPAVHFSVERFEAAEDFQPSRPYATRLMWRDLDGNDQSKLLLTKPEQVLAIAVQGEEPPAAVPSEHPAARRRAKRQRGAGQEPAPAPQ